MHQKFVFPVQPRILPQFRPWRIEKERGMEEHYATPALQEFPQLSQLPFLSPQNQGVIADYLAYLRTRHYAPAMQEGTIRALKSFAVLMPEARRARTCSTAAMSWRTCS